MIPTIVKKDYRTSIREQKKRPFPEVVPPRKRVAHKVRDWRDLAGSGRVQPDDKAPTFVP